MMLSSRRRSPPPSMRAYAGFGFPAEVIIVAVRWYLRFSPSYLDVQEPLVEPGSRVNRTGLAPAGDDELPITSWSLDNHP